MRRPRIHQADQPIAVGEDKHDSEQLQRRAGLIAEGRDSFPEDLPRPERDRLHQMVCRLLRDRLVEHVARAIALDLLGSEPSE